VSLSSAVQTIKSGQAAEVTVMDNDIMIKLKNQNKILVTSKENTTSVTEMLQREGINVENINLKVENRDGWKAFWDILSLILTIGPVILILWLVLARQGAGGPGGGIFGFGKSTAKIFIKGKQNMTFADVAGVTEAKRDLEEVVDFLKNPEKYRKMGARAPKGVLLVGPAGVGKTLLAKAVAGEANVPFFSMAGSEFMEMLVGVGASRVRDLFATAKKAGKAIIFIDEIDAIGRMRGGGMDGGHSERDQTLNQILVEMDGFEPSTAVVVLAATNRGDLLDPALLRPGRFDRRVVLEMPDLAARRDILKIHARGKPFEENVDWEVVARSTVGFSGAELENMLNEAAIAAARVNKEKISREDIEEASLKVKLGAEKRREQTDEDKLMTAYHEAGHAIVNYVEELDPVTRISIVSRGMALGFTLVPPKKDQIHVTKSKLIKQMAMAMGGRAAEEIVFGDITSGAASDIQHVTRIARDMVSEWGMSELGPVNYGPYIDTTDWGRAWMEPTKVSDEMQAKVDGEVKKLVDTALVRAREVLTKYRKKLDELAQVLVTRESIGEAEFEAMMNPALAKA
jgi:cell division protease FtsH